MGKTRDLLKKIGDTKGTFLAKMYTVNDRNSKDLTETEEIKVARIHRRTVQKTCQQLLLPTLLRGSSPTPDLPAIPWTFPGQTLLEQQFTDQKHFITPLLFSCYLLWQNVHNIKFAILPIFQCTLQWPLSAFMLLGRHHHHLSPELLHPPNLKPCAH